jgi:hypothetical protein
MGFQENHTTSGDSGRRSEGQIIDLEHHSHDVGKLDNSSRVKAELLIIVQDGVHVLNPHCVDGAIKHNPLSVRRSALSEVTDDNSQHTISPLVSGFIKVTVELILPDTLGVHHLHLNLEEVLVLGLLLMDASHSVFEDLDGVTLTSEGLSNHHESMANLDHIKELEGLLDKGLFRLEVHVLHTLSHGLHEHIVIGLREGNSREQVTSDTIVQRDI